MKTTYTDLEQTKASEPNSDDMLVVFYLTAILFLAVAMVAACYGQMGVALVFGIGSGVSAWLSQVCASKTR